MDPLSPVQNRRGGRVKLLSILLPETEFNHKDKVICHHVSGRTSLKSGAALAQYTAGTTYKQKLGFSRERPIYGAAGMHCGKG